jgi:CRP-like cAMP-binding protein
MNNCLQVNKIDANVNPLVNPELTVSGYSVFGNTLKALNLMLTVQRNESADSLRQGLEVLYKSSNVQTFRRGSAIPLSTHHISIVRQGVVHLGTLYPNGEESMIGIACNGMPFGLSLTQVDPYYATALTDVTLVSLKTIDVQQSEALTQLVMQYCTDRLRQVEALLATAGHRRVEDRLRQFLLLLAQELGQPTALGTRLHVRLTHQLLANATGTTRVTITRLLGQLRREGWLQIDRNHHIVICDHRRAA